MTINKTRILVTGVTELWAKCRSGHDVKSNQKY